MPDAHVYRVRVASEGWGGAPGLNSFYFLQDSTAIPDEAAAALDCATRVHDFFETLVTAFPVTWNGTVSPEVDIINTDNGDLVNSQIVTPPAAIVGTSGAGFGPQAAMICANLLTPGIIDGRRVRGRAFIGPMFAASDANGTPQDIVVGFVQDGLTDLMGGGLTQPPLVVWSRRRGVSVAHPTGLGGTAHIVSAVTVRDTFAVLTSRRG